jgi:hypothetical protein
MNPFTLENAKKAYSAGAAALVVAEGAVIGPVLADGQVSASEVGLLVATAVVSFVGAFFAAWLPAQPSSPQTEK